MRADVALPLDDPATAFGRILDGRAGDAEAGAYLVALAERGETAAEIAAAAEAMRARMVKVTAPAGAIDVCGTGGDGSHSLNVSTAVAIVAAACGVPVAKHGNRAASSRAGAADTLEALGLDLARAGALAERSLAELGIAFLFAQAHHPALVALAPLRRALGRRTIFNLLGPLANPAGVTRQLIGVADRTLLPVMDEACARLGSEDAMLVAGDEPLDELSVSGPSTALRLGGAPERVDPVGLGLPRHPIEALRGGSATDNAAALRRLLQGEAGAYRDAVLLNTAAALIVAGAARDWQDGIEEAAEAIDKGLAKALLDCWIAFCR